MRQKYPWEEWFSRSRIVLLRGIHYKCSQSAMSQIVRNNASAWGLRVKVTDTGTEIVVDVLGRRKVESARPHINTPTVGG